MDVIAKRDELRDWCEEARRSGVVGFVPTMGYLHDGHAALMRRAREETANVVVSIFVNPLQFGPSEDLASYPRDLDRDLARCRGEEVDAVFVPGEDEMYPAGRPEVTVDPGPLGDRLEGAARPGHFRGVCTVVAKLFSILGSCRAYFGEKDAQQLAVIRRMVADLELGVRIVGVPTVREPDGLALSSRNRYLSPDERIRALSLSRALRVGAAASSRGAGAVLAAATAELTDAEMAVDYLALRGADLGSPPAAGPARLLVAARVGTTRLIDNVPLTLGPG